MASWGGTPKRTAFPALARDADTRTGATRTKRGQRPPGAGRALAGGFGPPAAWDQRGAVAGAMAPAIAATQFRRRFGRDQETHCVSAARTRQFPVDRQVREKQKASARPGGREAPAGGGAGAGRGLWAPGGPTISGTLWQGRWPLPGCERRAQAEEFPAFRSGSPCRRHFSAPCQCRSIPGKSGRVKAQPRRRTSVDHSPMSSRWRRVKPAAT